MRWLRRRYDVFWKLENGWDRERGNGMPFFAVSSNLGEVMQSYWLEAGDEDEARWLVANNVSDAKLAVDSDVFECKQDRTLQPPNGLIVSGDGETFSIFSRYLMSPDQLI